MVSINQTTHKREPVWDALIVGAGPAGLGVALALQRLGLKRFQILERETVGASFRKWPREMKLISPSFYGNAYGAIDLNAIHPETSPAYNSGFEHLSGLQYAKYLDQIVKHFELPVRSECEVAAVRKVDRDVLELKLANGEILLTRNLVWAVGEFHFPRQAKFPGGKFARHSATITSWKELEGDRFVVIGGAESGCDAAIQLAAFGKKVTVFDPNAPWDIVGADPSESLSPYTRERLLRAMLTERVTTSKARIISIERTESSYLVYTDRESHKTPVAPILATGFSGSLRRINALLEWQGALPLLDENDRSTVTPGLYLAGPYVRHKIEDRMLIFCFIYKFRQRFPVVARAIGRSLGIDLSPLEYYRERGMLLEDLACTAAGCAC